MPPPPESGPLPDLSECAREPIHIPGAIQPHGCLLVLDDHSLNVIQVSANAEAFLGRAPDDLLGRPLTTALPSPQADLLRGALASPSVADGHPLRLDLDGRVLDAALHRGDGVVLLELEPAEATRSSLLGATLDLALKRLARCEDFASLVEATAGAVRELTGHDRVMVYRFDIDGHGEVIAESKLDEMESYLGLHYPESDIPLQARELYRRNWVRCIPDARYTTVPLRPPLRPDTGAPLDLSPCSLRSVSPVHLEYMANMGVRASMSVSLIVAGRLWGLISAGHRTPWGVPQALRSACETLGRVVSLQIGAMEALDFRRRQEQKAEGIGQLHAAMQRETRDVLLGLATQGTTLLEIAGAAGAAVVLGDKVVLVGACPPASVVADLARWIGDRIGDNVVFHSHSLSIDDPVWAPWAGVASGVLAIRLPTTTQRIVLWFRPELAHTVHWGGNPAKTGQLHDAGGASRLHPRRSFELWKEVVRGRTTRWEPAEVNAAAEVRRGAVDIDLQRQVVSERAAVQSRDDLVAIVSHDLRTPMSVVVMQAAVIQRVGNEDAAGLVQRFRIAAATIQRAGTRMTSLLNDLLDLSKIEAGRFTVAPTAHKASQLVRESTELMEPVARAADVVLVLEAEAEVSVRADPERIFQVFANLIGNAIKHGARGKEVRIGAAPIDGLCEFWVADDGPGIPAEHVAHIFDRYWQGRPSANSGAGLGLYIAKGIVEAHGGTLRVQSGPGVGATFIFTLPLA